jgi:hypothetical protein
MPDPHFLINCGHYAPFVLGLFLDSLGIDDRAAHHVEGAVLNIGEIRQTTILDLAANCPFEGLVHKSQLGIVGVSA